MLHMAWNVLLSPKGCSGNGMIAYTTSNSLLITAPLDNWQNTSGEGRAVEGNEHLINIFFHNNTIGFNGIWLCFSLVILHLLDKFHISPQPRCGIYLSFAEKSGSTSKHLAIYVLTTLYYYHFF